MTNWDERDVEIDLSFLPEGQWEASIYRDGINADTAATDHIIETVDITGKTVLPVHMAPGGGFAIIIDRKY